MFLNFFYQTSWYDETKRIYTYIYVYMYINYNFFFLKVLITYIIILRGKCKKSHVFFRSKKKKRTLCFINRLKPSYYCKIVHSPHQTLKSNTFKFYKFSYLILLEYLKISHTTKGGKWNIKNQNLKERKIRVCIGWKNWLETKNYDIML